MAGVDGLRKREKKGKGREWKGRGGNKKPWNTDKCGDCRGEWGQVEEGKGGINGGGQRRDLW